MEFNSLLAVTAVTALVAAALTAGGFYLYKISRGGDANFFAQRDRRLALIERSHLDGGRRLLLVRRDDVEHLILIGGPIDVIVESGIRAGRARGAAAEHSFAAARPETAAAWKRPEITLPTVKPLDPAGPELAGPGEAEKSEEPLELSSLQEAKPI